MIEQWKRGAPKSGPLKSNGAGSIQEPTPETSYPLEAMDVTKPNKFIWFGDIHGPKPYEFIWFGDIHGPKPYTFIGFRWALISQTPIMTRPALVATTHFLARPA